MPDQPGHWRGAGHVAVVVPVDGPCTAIVEADELQTRPVVDDIVVAADVIAAAGDALVGALGPAASRVGVLGSDAVPAPWSMSLDAMLRTGGRRAAFEAADDLHAPRRFVA